jgi:hypothetical protein
MCDEVKYSLHFDYPDKGKGNVAGPITYGPDGASMNFDAIKKIMDSVFGAGNYTIKYITMRPWFKNFIMSFALTEDFINHGLPISMKVKDFCKTAVENFKRLVGDK